MTIVKYFKGAEQPDVAITWRDNSNNVIDFASGYTFEMKLGHGGLTAVLTKTSGIAGAQTSPNLIITFTPAELDNVPTGMYEMQLRANQTSSNRDRFMRTWFLLMPSVQ